VSDQFMLVIRFLAFVIMAVLTLRGLDWVLNHKDDNL
jgi:hypothetical protein